MKSVGWFRPVVDDFDLFQKEMPRLFERFPVAEKSFELLSDFLLVLTVCFDGQGRAHGGTQHENREEKFISGSFLDHFARLSLCRMI